MQGMLKKMGISQEEIDASRVIIEKTDNSRIIIDNPSVTKIKMQGQETFQIAGDISEESAKEETSEEDIKMIIEKTGVSEEIARETLEKNNGDLAETILELSK
ncbi:MAG: Nascent polypeptide-associated complex protein [Candidatus Diapherotrites archaeon ADurb.Bin253]|nr:MAG: Nascent polypeptide-associated complex protein [Candidatus Diapherotrites archaeon ADurb.Bin253]